MTTLTTRITKPGPWNATDTSQPRSSSKPL
jgi:hypothetical protein